MRRLRQPLQEHRRQRRRPQPYTVQAGDTLSGIAKKLLGNAAEYMDIYNENRDQLTDPDKIKPGQVLKIPQPTPR